MLQLDKSFETLGVELAPAGQQDDIMHTLVEKVRGWVERIWASFLKEKDVTTAINTTILKILEYPLLVLTLTEKECEDILKECLLSELDKLLENDENQH